MGCMFIYEKKLFLSYFQDDICTKASPIKRRDLSRAKKPCWPLGDSNFPPFPSRFQLRIFPAPFQKQAHRFPHSHRVSFFRAPKEKARSPSFPFPLKRLFHSVCSCRRKSQNPPGKIFFHLIPRRSGLIFLFQAKRAAVVQDSRTGFFFILGYR